MLMMMTIVLISQNVFNPFNARCSNLLLFEESSALLSNPLF